MDNEYDKYLVQKKKDRTELESFILIFGQDWDLVFPDFLTGTQMYYIGLSQKRRDALSEAFAMFLDDNLDNDYGSFNKKWIKLGAGAYPPKKEYKKIMREMLKILQGKVTVPDVKTPLYVW